MNALQIEYFLEVANKASFTKASKSLYVSQSSISHQIAIFETELGVTLFDRTKSGRIIFYQLALYRTHISCEKNTWKFN